MTADGPNGSSVNGTRPAAAYSFEALPGGIARLQMNARLMHLDDARPLCGEIEGVSRGVGGVGGDAISLVVDLGRVGFATPAAAFHGFTTLRHVRIDSIALVNGSPAIRRMATLMLRAASPGHLRRFGFFDDEQAAVAWLQGEAGDTTVKGPYRNYTFAPRGSLRPERKARGGRLPGSRQPTSNAAIGDAGTLECSANSCTGPTPGGLPHTSPPAAPTPSGRQRAAVRIAAGVTAAALAGGLAAARRRNGRRRRSRAPRGPRASPSRRPARMRRAGHER